MLKRNYLFISTMGVLAGAAMPAGAAFTVGNLVILTDASTGTSSGSVALDEFAYNGNGTFATTPTVHAISGVTLSGDTDHSGLLHQSTDGNSLVFGGFAASAGIANVDTTTSVVAPRAIETVYSNWITTSTTVLTSYSGITLRSVSSTDGQHFWTGGDQNTANGGVGGGQYYVDASGPSVVGTQISTNDARASLIDHGQLYSISSSVGGVSKFATALPTSLTTSSLIITGNAKSDVTFLDTNNDGVDDVAYTTDGKNILDKWSFNGTTWTNVGEYSGSKTSINNIDGLAAIIYNGSVELFATSYGVTGVGGELFEFTDTNSNTTGFSFTNTTPTPILSSVDDSVFRGIAVLGAGTSVPEPASIAMLGVGALVSLRRRRCC